MNPLPGLTPGYSDLCLIAQAAGIEYRTLIGEILAGGLKRLREKRREAQERGRDADGEAGGRKAEAATPSDGRMANGDGHGNGNGNGSGGGRRRPPGTPTTPAADAPRRRIVPARE